VGVERKLNSKVGNRIRYKANMNLRKLNRYVINPLREQDVFDKIEDISLLHSKYHHYFKKYPRQLLRRGEPRKIPDNIHQENSPANLENDK
jgi:hypothetical protein